MQIDLADGWLLVNQCVLGVLGPVIGGADDNAMCERLAPRRGEKAVDILLLQLVVRIEELALDSVDFAAAGHLRHQIDAVVLGS